MLRRLRRIVTIALSAFVVLVSSLVGGWRYAFCVVMQRPMPCCCEHRQHEASRAGQTPDHESVVPRASAPCCEMRVLPNHDAGYLQSGTAHHATILPTLNAAPVVAVALSQPVVFQPLRLTRIRAPRGPPLPSARAPREALCVSLLSLLSADA